MNSLDNVHHVSHAHKLARKVEIFNFVKIKYSYLDEPNCDVWHLSCDQKIHKMSDPTQKEFIVLPITLHTNYREFEIKAAFWHYEYWYIISMAWPVENNLLSTYIINLEDYYRILTDEYADQALEFIAGSRNAVARHAESI